MGCPLEIIGSPRHRARIICRELGHRHRAGDLGQPGQHPGLLVGQLPGPGLQHLDQPRVRDVLPGQPGQHTGQLRTGR